MENRTKSTQHPKMSFECPSRSLGNYSWKSLHPVPVFLAKYKKIRGGSRGRERKLQGQGCRSLGPQTSSTTNRAKLGHLRAPARRKYWIEQGSWTKYTVRSGTAWKGALGWRRVAKQLADPSRMFMFPFHNLKKTTYFCFCFFVCFLLFFNLD